MLLNSKSFHTNSMTISRNLYGSSSYHFLVLSLVEEKSHGTGNRANEISATMLNSCYKRGAHWPQTIHYVKTKGSSTANEPFKILLGAEGK